MHHTALINAQYFFENYSSALEDPLVIDIGAQDVNGSLKEVTPEHARYIGVDFIPGPGVDVVLTDPYKLPFEDNSVDIVISSSCFEHSEMFWLLFLEIMRVLKPHGLFYLNVPSNGPFHQYPVDCWRFYPDSGKALVSWAKHNGHDAVLLESYISKQYLKYWNDFVAVILKDQNQGYLYSERIIDKKKDFYNGISSKSENIINRRKHPEDFVRFIYRFKRLKWRLKKILNRH